MEFINNSKISIIIRCYNEEQHIDRLLHGIMQQSVRNKEIIVVDSGSTDSTLSIASRYPAKILSINPEMFSFGHSLNVGCESASGDFIVIVSAHAYPLYKDWLEKLVGPFINPNIALVYGKQRGDGNTAFSEYQIFSKWFPDVSNYEQDHPFCNNANSVIRRSLWQKVSYNEDLTGLEDIDWANRIIRRGFKIAYEADAEIIHVHNESLIEVYNRYRREAIAMKRIFPHEQFHFRDFLRLFSTNVFNDYVHAVQSDIFFSQCFRILFFRLMQFGGTYRGYSRNTSINTHLRETFYYPNKRNRISNNGQLFNSNRPMVNYRREFHHSHEDN